MGALNVVRLTGTVKGTPIFKYIDSKRAMLRIRVVPDSNKVNSETMKAEPMDSGGCIDVLVFSKQAEVCNRVLNDGMKIAVEGRIETGKYSGTGMGEEWYTNVVARNVRFI